jgi:predicted DNA-binding protein (MmcQ/YjbR family)
MDIEQLRQYAINKPDAEETLPFGPETLVFKVNGKVFLLLSLDSEPLQFNVKCNPDDAIELRERYTAVIPGYHMNKKHWNTIIINGELSAKQIFSFIDDSYNLVKPKKSFSRRKR